MTPAEIVARLQAMHTEVQRMMPHVGCQPHIELNDNIVFGICTCYKQPLLAAIRDAEMKVREVAGMEPF